ncbi:hypothetical protein Bpfe_020914, partial [Biomphalaria pfeifferi]
MSSSAHVDNDKVDENRHHGQEDRPRADPSKVGGEGRDSPASYSSSSCGSSGRADGSKAKENGTVAHGFNSSRRM